ncbi:hypothetical protein AB1Y20_011328 [Prymnesium parvum]|uniref:Ubiquitin-like domain-containing protein n=1 Tax=Prymnesium parvum TaxID=97485 RepID=A0AB34IQ89_PRYPA
MAEAESSAQDEAPTQTGAAARVGGENEKAAAEGVNIDELRERFIGPKALAAGAAEIVWYTDEMLVAREALRSEESVQAAMQYAWDTLTTHTGEGGGLISRADYTTMCRKIYLVIKAREYEADFDPMDCLEYVAADWFEDSKGKTHLDRAAFFSCLFELADVNTRGISAQEYAQWIVDLVDEIMPGEDDEPDYFGYRDDLEHLKKIEAYSMVKKEFQQQRDHWMEFFNRMIPDGPPRRRARSEPAPASAAAPCADAEEASHAALDRMRKAATRLSKLSDLRPVRRPRATADPTAPPPPPTLDTAVQAGGSSWVKPEPREPPPPPAAAPVLGRVSMVVRPSAAEACLPVIGGRRHNRLSAPSRLLGVASEAAPAAGPVMVEKLDWECGVIEDVEAAAEEAQVEAAASQQVEEAVVLEEAVAPSVLEEKSEKEQALLEWLEAGSEDDSDEEEDLEDEEVELTEGEVREDLPEEPKPQLTVQVPDDEPKRVSRKKRKPPPAKVAKERKQAVAASRGRSLPVKQRVEPQEGCGDEIQSAARLRKAPAGRRRPSPPGTKPSAPEKKTSALGKTPRSSGRAPQEKGRPSEARDVKAKVPGGREGRQEQTRATSPSDRRSLSRQSNKRRSPRGPAKLWALEEEADAPPPYSRVVGFALAWPSPLVPGLGQLMTRETVSPSYPVRSAIAQKLAEWRAGNEAALQEKVAQLTGASASDVHVFLSAPDAGSVPVGTECGMLVSFLVDMRTEGEEEARSDEAEQRAREACAHALSSLRLLAFDAEAAVGAFGGAGRAMSLPKVRRVGAAEARALRRADASDPTREALAASLLEELEWPRRTQTRWIPAKWLKALRAISAVHAFGAAAKGWGEEGGAIPLLHAPPQPQAEPGPPRWVLVVELPPALRSDRGARLPLAWDSGETAASILAKIELSLGRSVGGYQLYLKDVPLTAEVTMEAAGLTSGAHLELRPRAERGARAVCVSIPAATARPAPGSVLVDVLPGDSVAQVCVRVERLVAPWKAELTIDGDQTLDLARPANDLQLDSNSIISAVLKPREAPALVLHVSVPALPVLKTLKVPLLEMDSLATLYSKLATLLAIDAETLKISIPGVTLEALKKYGVAKALEASRTEKGCIALVSIAGEPPRDYLRVEVHLPSGFHDSIGGESIALAMQPRETTASLRARIGQICGRDMSGFVLARGTIRLADGELSAQLPHYSEAAVVHLSLKSARTAITLQVPDTLRERFGDWIALEVGAGETRRSLRQKIADLLDLPSREVHFLSHGAVWTAERGTLDDLKDGDELELRLGGEPQSDETDPPCARGDLDGPSCGHAHIHGRSDSARFLMRDAHGVDVEFHVRRGDQLSVLLSQLRETMDIRPTKMGLLTDTGDFFNVGSHFATPGDLTWDALLQDVASVKAGASGSAVAVTSGQLFAAILLVVLKDPSTPSTRTRVMQRCGPRGYRKWVEFIGVESWPWGVAATPLGGSPPPKSAVSSLDGGWHTTPGPTDSGSAPCSSARSNVSPRSKLSPLRSSARGSPLARFQDGLGRWGQEDERLTACASHVECFSPSAASSYERGREPTVLPPGARFSAGAGSATIDHASLSGGRVSPTLGTPGQSAQILSFSPTNLEKEPSPRKLAGERSPSTTPHRSPGASRDLSPSRLATSEPRQQEQAPSVHVCAYNGVEGVHTSESRAVARSKESKLRRQARESVAAEDWRRPSPLVDVQHHDLHDDLKDVLQSHCGPRRQPFDLDINQLFPGLPASPPKSAPSIGHQDGGVVESSAEVRLPRSLKKRTPQNALKSIHHSALPERSLDKQSAKTADLHVSRSLPSMPTRDDLDEIPAKRGLPPVDLVLQMNAGTTQVVDSPFRETYVGRRASVPRKVPLSADRMHNGRPQY